MLTLVAFGTHYVRGKMLPGFEDGLRLESAVCPPLPVRETRLEQRPHGLEQKVFGQMPIDTNQAFARIHIDSRWSKQFIERSKRTTSKLCVTESLAKRPMQCVTTILVNR